MEYKNIRNKNENCEVYKTTNMEIREALIRFDAAHGITALGAELERSYLRRDLNRAGIEDTILELDSPKHDEVLDRFGVEVGNRKSGFLYLSAPADSVTQAMFVFMAKAAGLPCGSEPVIRSFAEVEA